MSLNVESMDTTPMVDIAGSTTELNQREAFQTEKVGHAQLQQSRGEFVDINENVAELNLRDSFETEKGPTLGQQPSASPLLTLEDTKNSTETMNMKRKQSFRDVRGPIHGAEHRVPPQSCRSSASNPFEEIRKKCALRGHRHSMSLTQMEIMHGLKESAEFTMDDAGNHSRSPSRTPSHQLFETVMQKAVSLNSQGGSRRGSLRRAATLA